MTTRGSPLSVATVSSDDQAMEAQALEMILARYVLRSHEFDRIAASRRGLQGVYDPAYTSQRSSPLSEREIEVLQCAAEGHTNREIANRLYLSEETVKSHLCRILRKLNTRSRAHAVAEGFRHGVLA